MTPEVEQRLLERIAATPHDGYNLDGWRSRWNEEPPGWTPIVDEAITKLLAITHPDGSVWSGQVTVIKEKFGGLRIGIWGLPADEDAIQPYWNIINEAEVKASYTCQDCGETPATAYCPKHWIKTLCQKCAPEGAVAFDLEDLMNPKPQEEPCDP